MRQKLNKKSESAQLLLNCVNSFIVYAGYIITHITVQCIMLFISREYIRYLTILISYLAVIEMRKIEKNFHQYRQFLYFLLSLVPLNIFLIQFLLHMNLIKLLFLKVFSAYFPTIFVSLTVSFSVSI